MLKFVLIIIAILALFFIVVMIVDCHRLVIRKYDFASEKVSSELSMVLLTDLHGVCFGKNNYRLINKIDTLKPDIIVIAGDMFTCSHRNSGIENATALLEKLSLKYPIYYADGNHELKTRIRTDEFGKRYEEYESYLSSKGVSFINNESVYLSSNNVSIYGLSLDFDYYKKFLDIKPSVEYINELIKVAKKDSYCIVLAHNPEYFDEYSGWGADLVLSGHYHGGLMRIPFIGGVISPRYRLFPKYDYGLFKRDKANMLLSCGLGTHTLPIRIFNPGEISYITLH